MGLRYLAKMVEIDGAPLYPKDAEEALLVDEVCDFIEDIWGQILMGIFQAPPEEKLASAQRLLGSGGTGSQMLDRLESAVVGPCVLGARKTMADVYIFCAFCHWSSGFFPGISVEGLVGSRPKLKGILQLVGGMSIVREYYSKKDFSKKSQALWKVYGEFSKL